MQKQLYVTICDTLKSLLFVLTFQPIFQIQDANAAL